MPSLSDIVAAKEPVTVGDKTFHVRGLSAADIAKLLIRFPELRSAWMQRDNVSAESWFATIPGLVPIVIAAGLGKIEDDKTVSDAGELTFETQMAFFEPIFRLTMPSGFMSFVNRLTAMIQGATGAVPTMPSPMTSVSSQTGRVTRPRATKSPSRSKR